MGFPSWAVVQALSVISSSITMPRGTVGAMILATCCPAAASPDDQHYTEPQDSAVGETAPRHQANPMPEQQKSDSFSIFRIFTKRKVSPQRLNGLSATDATFPTSATMHESQAPDSDLYTFGRAPNGYSANPTNYFAFAGHERLARGAAASEDRAVADTLSSHAPLGVAAPPAAAFLAAQEGASTPGSDSPTSAQVFVPNTWAASGSISGSISPTSPRSPFGKTTASSASVGAAAAAVADEAMCPADAAAATAEAARPAEHKRKPSLSTKLSWKLRGEDRGDRGDRGEHSGDSPAGGSAALLEPGTPPSSSPAPRQIDSASRSSFNASLSASFSASGKRISRFLARASDSEQSISHGSYSRQDEADAPGDGGREAEAGREGDEAESGSGDGLVSVPAGAQRATAADLTDAAAGGEWRIAEREETITVETYHRKLQMTRPPGAFAAAEPTPAAPLAGGALRADAHSAQPTSSGSALLAAEELAAEDLARLPNKNRVGSYPWLTQLLESVVANSSEPLEDLSTGCPGRPLFVVAGACPNSFCGMQAVLYALMHTPRLIDFWWVKPSATDANSIEPQTINRHAKGAHKNDPGRSRALYAQFADLFSLGDDEDMLRKSTKGGGGLLRFGVARHGAMLPERAFIEQVVSGERYYVYFIWQEDWTSNPFARSKFIRGKIAYQRDPAAPQLYVRPYAYRDGTLDVPQDAQEYQIATALPPDGIKLGCIDL